MNAHIFRQYFKPSKIMNKAIFTIHMEYRQNKESIDDVNNSIDQTQS